MPPLTRYTAHRSRATGDWLVYDNLRAHLTHDGLTAWGAADVVRVQEETWRTRCDRRQQEEHREWGSTW